MSSWRSFAWPRRVLLGALLLAPGCIGGTAHWHDRTHFVAPELGDGPWAGTVVNGSSAPRMSSEALLASWGEPDERSTRDDGSERWVYVGEDLTWAGVMPVLIIVPLPLILPTGHERASFTVRDGVVTEADFVTQDEASALVGLLISGPCFAVNSSRFYRTVHASESSRSIRPRHAP